MLTDIGSPAVSSTALLLIYLLGVGDMLPPIDPVYCFPLSPLCSLIDPLLLMLCRVSSAAGRGAAGAGGGGPERDHPQQPTAVHRHQVQPAHGRGAGQAEAEGPVEGPAGRLAHAQHHAGQDGAGLAGAHCLGTADSCW